MKRINLKYINIIMNNNNIKQVHKYINIKNDAWSGGLTINEKKLYLKLIKPYTSLKVSSYLHLLPKKDITLILKNNFDYEKNKNKINKIVKKHFYKVNKRKEQTQTKNKKACKRYYGNTKVREKEDLLLKTLNKKSKKRKFIVFQKGIMKKTCKQWY